LPEEELLVIPEESFNLILASTDETEITGNRSNQQADFYSEGTLGGGSMTHVLGSIALYKLGPDLRFRLHFAHEGLDGYNFHNAGEGFFHREETLDGSLSLSLDKLNLNAQASYIEEEEGFQGRSALFDSVIDRFTDGESTFLFNVTDWLLLQAQAGSTFVNRILKGGTPENISEIWVQPTLGALFSFPVVTFGLNGIYGFKNLIGYENFLTHKWGVELNFETSFDLAFMLKGKAGLLWYSTDALHFPFSLTLSATIPKTNLSFEFSGGYMVTDQTFFQLWKETSMLAIEEGFGPKKSWFGKGEIQWKLFEGFTLLGGANVERSYTEVGLLATPDLITGLIPYNVTSLLRVTPHAGFSWDWKNIVNVTFDFNLQAYEKQPYDPIMQFSLDAELRSPEGKYGLNFLSDWDIYYALEIPKMSLGGFVRITEGVEFSLEVEDFLAPIFAVDRFMWNDSRMYEARGFLVTLKALVSL
jgi:hypothetical protein